MRGAKLRARGFEVRAGREPPEQLGHPVHAAIDHRGVEVMRARHDVRDDLGLRRIRHRWLDDAHDRCGAIAESYRPADDGRIALPRGRPEAVCQHRRARGLRAIVGRTEQPAQHRPEPHHLEVRAADDTGAYDAGLAEADHRELDDGEVAERADGLHALLEIAELRHREVGVLDLDARRALADVDQTILIAIGKRAEQHAANHAEDRGVRADSERQGDDDGDGESLDPGEGAQRKTEVGHEAETERP